MSVSRISIIFISVLVVAGALIAIGYVIWRTSSLSLDGTYEVRDAFVDTTGIELATVSFVRVDEYDSLHVLRVAQELTRASVEGGELDPMRRRSFLYHFFIAGDTAALTEEMIDELAYEHPSIQEPQRRLMYVPNGWVVKAAFAPKMRQPKSIECHQVPFYMARPGVRAKDLQ